MNHTSRADHLMSSSNTQLQALADPLKLSTPEAVTNIGDIMHDDRPFISNFCEIFSPRKSTSSKESLKCYITASDITIQCMLYALFHRCINYSHDGSSEALINNTWLASLPYSNKATPPESCVIQVGRLGAQRVNIAARTLFKIDSVCAARAMTSSIPGVLL